MKTIRRLAVFLSLAFLLGPLTPLSAQEEAPPQPEGRVMVEQVSETHAVGTWTLLQPNHESFSRTDAALDVPNLRPGHYTFFAEPPSGTTTRIDIYLGDDVIATSDTPQISFDLLDAMTLRIAVHYALTVFGKIGVNSDPVGVPFDLRGPDGYVNSGVTPVEIPKAPVGQYSVAFSPAGCTQPAAQSNALTANGRVDFMIRLVCKDFRAVTGVEKPATVSAEVGNQTVTFGDVPTDSWFGAYVATVAKRGIMAGYADAQGKLTGRFGPADPVTLAQLAKIIHVLLKLDVNKVTAIPQNLGARGQWYARYAASAEERGWLIYLDPAVDLNRPATRGEVMISLLQALDIPMRWTKGGTFTDVLRSTPFASAIETAAGEGIVSGRADSDGELTGTFEPQAPVARSEMAKILIVVHEKYLDEEEGL